MTRNEILRKPLWSADDIAFLLGFEVRTIRKEIASGKLPSAVIGKRRMMTKVDLEAYLGADRAAEILAVTP